MVVSGCARDASCGSFCRACQTLAGWSGKTRKTPVCVGFFALSALAGRFDVSDSHLHAAAGCISSAAKDGLHGGQETIDGTPTRTRWRRAPRRRTGIAAEAGRDLSVPRRGAGSADSRIADRRVADEHRPHVPRAAADGDAVRHAARPTDGSAGLAGVPRRALPRRRRRSVAGRRAVRPRLRRHVPCLVPPDGASCGSVLNGAWCFARPVVSARNCNRNGPEDRPDQRAHRAGRFSGPILHDRRGFTGNCDVIHSSCKAALRGETEGNAERRRALSALPRPPVRLSYR